MADTKTLTLTDFLLARIAEDEALARAAFSDDLGGSYNSPRVDDGRWQTGSHEMDEQRVDGIGITIYDEGGHSTEQAVHIARHDPARVLAECEAKRQIVEKFNDDPWCLDGGYVYTDFALRALALPYADHPDYREGWRP